ncbi:hypothetical protein [Streptomyces yaizuensis]|uniref:Uncharacterized protein n=1 Tax=Streptomyces yaizuensis TaxID=2989713 RepID=A0ABQ5NWB1_9ACTN|nr:hypothetical protein [Streptomyces sp. YSPA8]GLF94650.1 hypothetical protein SYYSPA8_10155 [Streptomyces sp. YSPA8]
MAEIDVPGDGVKRAGTLLGRVLDLSETKASGFDVATVGPPRARPGLPTDRKRRDDRLRIAICNCTELMKSRDVGREFGDAPAGDGSGRKT